MVVIGLQNKGLTLKEERKEYALEYAGFWIRFASSLIDIMIMISSIYILYCVVSQSFFWILPGVPSLIKEFGGINNDMAVSGSQIWLIATVLLVYLVGNTIYYVACWVTTGQTVGKLSVGIKIIRTDSSRLDFKYAFIRFLGSLLCVATLGIGFIVIAFDKRKQGLHDRIADTYVVKLPVKKVVFNASLARDGIG
jgi:uncharacterized RDD family membrane protein YckC